MGGEHVRYFSMKVYESPVITMEAVGGIVRGQHGPRELMQRDEIAMT
jgi:hypothetical protein